MFGASGRIYLVIAELSFANFVGFKWPEARAIRSEDFINKNNLLSALIQAEFEFGVGDDDSSLLSVVSCL